jgi:hypothetical protein
VTDLVSNRLDLLAELATMSAIPDAVSAAPDVYRVLLENDRVHVLDVRLKPGTSPPIQADPDVFSHSLNPGRLRVHPPKRESMDELARARDDGSLDAAQGTTAP